MRRMIGGVAILLGFAAITQGAGPERWLHVRVVDSEQGETVNVNVPLSMAEKVLPAINKSNLHDGRISIGDADMNGVDLRAILDALRTAPDDDFVTVQSKDDNVRVAKKNGSLIIHVVEHDQDNSHVEITMPMRVVDAMVSKGTNDLDLTAAIRELEQMGDMTLVKVNEASQTVRIWVDSSNTQQ